MAKQWWHEIWFLGPDPDDDDAYDKLVEGIEALGVEYQGGYATKNAAVENTFHEAVEELVEQARRACDSYADPLPELEKALAAFPEDKKKHK